MDPYLKYGLLVPLTLLWGRLSVYGGKREWAWLVDPPESLMFVYSQAFVKVCFGKEATKTYTIATGWITLAIAIWEVAFL